MPCTFNLHEIMHFAGVTTERYKVGNLLVSVTLILIISACMPQDNESC